jgi:anti-sigma factor RsiW
MNHQPFEEWLLAEEDLTPAQKEALYQHLDDCPDCPKLARAWQEVHAEIRRAPQATPAPGFSARFAERLERENARKQRRYTWLALAFFLAAGFGTGLYLLYQQAGSLPTPVQGLASLLSSLNEMADTGRFISALIRTLPVPLTLAVWISLACSLLFWTLTWFLIVWRLPKRKGVFNEVRL